LEAADILSLGFYAVEIRSANSSLTDVEDQLNDSFGLTDMANINGLMAELSAANAAVTSACQGMTTPTATPTTPAATPTATPSGTSSGSTQQYYQNGASFVLLDDGIILTGGGSVQADCAETAADPGADNTGNSGAGRAGNFPQDTGPTVADQTAWISGCVAQENAYPVSVLSSVTPAATTPAATTPAATTPAATTPAATTPAATTPAATTPAATTGRV
jgi:subtilase-type serine protease